MYKVGRCRLRTLRNKRGWTQDELSTRSGISKSSISSFENEKRQMPADFVHDRALSLQLIYIVFRNISMINLMLS